jgi:hypothetical protein
MADKNKPFQTFTFNLDETSAEEVPAPPPALERLFEPKPAPAQPLAVQPPPAPAKPLKKGGRPKGPVKIKRSYYLAFDLSRFEEIRLNTARNGGILIKDDGGTVDLALELLDYISANPDLAHLIKQTRSK